MKKIVEYHQKKETLQSPVSMKETVESPDTDTPKKLLKETKPEENGGLSEKDKMIPFQKSCKQNVLEDKKQSIPSETKGNNESRKQHIESNLDVRHQKLDKSKYGEGDDHINMGNEGDKQFADRSDKEDKE